MDWRWYVGVVYERSWLLDGLVQLVFIWDPETGICRLQAAKPSLLKLCVSTYHASNILVERGQQHSITYTKH
jgi:hypothetical protein